MNQSKSKAAYVATLAVLLACMVLGIVRRRRSWNGNKKWVRVRRKDLLAHFHSLRDKATYRAAHGRE